MWRRCSINRRDEASRDQNYLQRLLQHRNPSMVPKVTAAMTSTPEHLTLTHKLRKPLVERLRRERIDTCIEQLKSLLGPEFLKQQPDSKLEKADILEMTVCFLTQLQQQNQQQRNLLNSFSKLQTVSDEKLREADLFPLSSTVQTSIMKDNSALWRPW